MICHEHECVFIHIPKNAGQSIESVFLRLVNLRWAARAPLLLRANTDPKAGPPRLAHLKAHEYVGCGHLEEAQFSRYFKFAFVRNPWDRMVSIYKYMGLRKGLSFKEFLMGEFLHDIWENRDWFVGPQISFIYGPGGELMVDFLGRFEQLQEDFQLVCQRLGLPPLKLPHANRSKGQKFGTALKRALQKRIGLFCTPEKPALYRNYQEYYDEESKDLVTQLYGKDIERFGYGFGAEAV